MKIKTIEQLVILGLRELHSAETQIIKALPVLIDAATNPDLQEGLSSHLEETKVHLQRLNDIFRSLDTSPRGNKSEIAHTLITEGSSLIKSIDDNEMVDDAIISAAQKVEHYEISAYKTAIAHAELLGETEIANLLKETLAEEENADAKLTQVSQDVLPKILQESDLVGV